MTAPGTDHHRALGLYSRLIALYPLAYRQRFGPEMRRTFEDLYRSATRGERRVGAGFWLAVLWDEGRAIIRERAAEPQGDLLFYGLVLIWGVGVLITPVIPVVSDWRNLVLPAAILAFAYLVLPGRTGLVRRGVTVAGVLVAVEGTASVAHSLREPLDLLAPVLLVACMGFAIKTMAGVNASIVGTKDAVSNGDELAFGVLAGLAGAAGLVLGLLDTSDGNPSFAVFFYVVVPVVCAVAGFRVGRRTLSVRTGIYAALGVTLIGAMIWLVALPLLYEGVLVTVYHGHAAPALLPLYWQRPLSFTLFWTATNGMIGAYFGVASLRKSEAAPHSSS